MCSLIRLRQRAFNPLYASSNLVTCLPYFGVMDKAQKAVTLLVPVRFR